MSVFGTKAIIIDIVIAGTESSENAAGRLRSVVCSSLWLLLQLSCSLAFLGTHRGVKIHRTITTETAKALQIHLMSPRLIRLPTTTATLSSVRMHTGPTPKNMCLAISRTFPLSTIRTGTYSEAEQSLSCPQKRSNQPTLSSPSSITLVRIGNSHKQTTGIIRQTHLSTSATRFYNPKTITDHQDRA